MKWLLPVFASQVNLIYPLADLTIVYTTCPENQIALSETTKADPVLARPFENI